MKIELADEETTVTAEPGTEGREVVEEVVTDDSFENYVGSKDVNPEQRPIKKIDREMFSTKVAIDRLVMDSGEDIFIPKDVVEELEKEKKPEKKEVSEEETTEADKDKTEDDKEFNAEAFFEKSGISKEDFSSFDEKLQEKIVDIFAGSEDNSAIEKIAEANTKVSELNTVISDLYKDPTIAARIEEVKTGKKYVADDLPVVTKTEASKLIGLVDDPDAFEVAVNELMASKGEQVIAVERSISENNARISKLKEEALNVVQKMVEKEPRIGIKEKDLSKINESHSDWHKLHGEGGMFDIFKKMHYTLKQIVAKGPDRLLREIADEKGWSKDRDKKIKQSGKKEFLEQVRLAAKQARTINPDKKSGSSVSTGSGGYDRASLVSEIASGKTTTWERLAADADSRRDRKMMYELQKIHEEGLAAGKRRKTKEE